MSKLLKRSVIYTTGIISFIFTIVPESILGKYVICAKLAYETNILLSRIIICLIVYSIIFLGCTLVANWRKSLRIKGKNYSIKILYKDIFEMNDCLKVIPFDECYTAKVGRAANEINSTSICGQYLKKYPIEDMKTLIKATGLQPMRSKSKYNKKERYESGTIIPREDYLLLAFTKLDHEGIGKMSREEYIECLFLMWKEIDKYHEGKSVCIPILGSGVTRIDDKSLTQQELLDIIIASYKMCSNKIKEPKQLFIVCRPSENFELKDIGEYI